MTIERTPARSGATCGRCASALRPGASFCVACGAPTGGGPGHGGFVPQPRTPADPFVPVDPRPSANTYVPAPRTPLAPFAPYASDPEQQRARTTRIAVVGGALLVVIALVVGTVLVVRESSTTAASPSTTPSVGGPTVAASSDPTAQLRAQRDADASAVEGTVGTWVPQLSAKKPGMVADGTAYDAAAVLADHQRLRAQYPGALLVWSGDWSSFKGSDYWVTVVGQTFATGAQANAWCVSAGFDADHCYAKRLAHSGGYAGNTVLRG